MGGGAGGRASVTASCMVILVPSMHCRDLCQADNFRGVLIFPFLLH